MEQIYDAYYYINSILKKEFEFIQKPQLTLWGDKPTKPIEKKRILYIKKSSIITPKKKKFKLKIKKSS